MHLAILSLLLGLGASLAVETSSSGDENGEDGKQGQLLDREPTMGPTTTHKHRHSKYKINNSEEKRIIGSNITPALSQIAVNRNAADTLHSLDTFSLESIDSRDGTLLKWSLVQPSRKIPLTAQRKALMNAFRRWEQVAAIRIIESNPEDANIKIKFEKFDHDDGYPFDGKDGILAHAFYPNDGRVHFDDDESWMVGDITGGKYLESIATHEFGHVLGLRHSNVYNAVMAPYYQGHTNNFQLHQDDIEAIQRLYGARLPTTTVGTSRALSPSLPNPCKLRFDDIVRLPDGRYYIFRKQWIYKLNAHHSKIEEGWPKVTADLYDQFPDDPDGVAYSIRSYRLYVFKGDKVWRYYKKRLDKGFPVNMKSKVSGIQTAFTWRGGNIYIIAARQLYKFRESVLTLTKVGSMKGVFPDAPHNPEAAEWDGKSSIHFFRGSKAYIVDDMLRTVQHGSPYSKHKQWLDC